MIYKPQRPGEHSTISCLECISNWMESRWEDRWLQSLLRKFISLYLGSALWNEEQQWNLNHLGSQNVWQKEQTLCSTDKKLLKRGLDHVSLTSSHILFRRYTSQRLETPLVVVIEEGSWRGAENGRDGAHCRTRATSWNYQVPMWQVRKILVRRIHCREGEWKNKRNVVTDRAKSGRRRKRED